MRAGSRQRDGRSPPPCRSLVWSGCLDGGGSTVVGIGSVGDVEVGVVDGSGNSAKSHAVALVVVAFGEGGLGDVEEGVDEGAFAGVLAPQDDQVFIVELMLRPRFVEELRPHQSFPDIISQIVKINT